MSITVLMLIGIIVLGVVRMSMTMRARSGILVITADGERVRAGPLGIPEVLLSIYLIPI